jgi:hypothetical protein
MYPLLVTKKPPTSNGSHQCYIHKLSVLDISSFQSKASTACPEALKIIVCQASRSRSVCKEGLSVGINDSSSSNIEAELASVLKSAQRAVPKTIEPEICPE